MLAHPGVDPKDGNDERRGTAAAAAVGRPVILISKSRLFFVSKHGENPAITHEKQ